MSISKQFSLNEVILESGGKITVFSLSYEKENLQISLRLEGKDIYLFAVLKKLKPSIFSSLELFSKYFYVC